MDLKAFADELGMCYIGKDFEMLKRTFDIKLFDIGQITVFANGENIELNLYEEASAIRYIIVFNTKRLISHAYYKNLDKPGIEKIKPNNYLARARLRVQSALLDLWRTKDDWNKKLPQKKLYKFDIALGGTLIIKH